MSVVLLHHPFRQTESRGNQMQFPLPTLAIFNSSYFRKRSLQSIRKKSKSTASFPKQWYLPMAQATLKVLQRNCATSHTKLGCMSAALHRYDQCTQIQQKEKKNVNKDRRGPTQKQLSTNDFAAFSI